MDAKELQQWRDAIMAEVNKLIAARFQSNGEILSDDSKLAIQQLVAAMASVRDLGSKNNSDILLFRDGLSDVQREIGAIRGILASSRVATDVERLKEGLSKVTLHVESDDTRERVNKIDESLTLAASRLFKVESAIQVLSSGGKLASSGQSPNVTDQIDAHFAPHVKKINAIEASLANIVSLAVFDDVIKTLEDRINTIANNKYDDSDLKAQLATISDTVNKLTNTPIEKPFDPTALKRSIDEINSKVAALTALIAAQQPQDLTPLTSRISKLEEQKSTAIQPMGMFGLGGVPPTDPIVNNRIDAVEARIKTLAEAENKNASTLTAIIQVGASKADVEKLAEIIRTLEAKIVLLESKQTTH